MTTTSAAPGHTTSQRLAKPAPWFKWPLAAVVALAVLWLAFTLNAQRQPLWAVAALAIGAVAVYVYVSARTLAWRYLFPGVAAMLAFVAFPLLYTVQIGFTNYSSNNLLELERARAYLLDQTVADEEHARAFTLHAEGRLLRLRLEQQQPGGPCGLVHPAHAVGRRAGQGGSAERRVADLRGEAQAWRGTARSGDGAVAQADRPGHAVDQAGVEVEQGERVGQQPPAALDQGGTERTLAGASGPGQQRCAAATLDDCGTQHQELVGAGRDAVVQAVFQQRQRQPGIARRRRPSVQVEARLGRLPKALAAFGQQVDVEVGEGVQWREFEVAVGLGQALGQRRQRRVQPGHERAQSQLELAGGEAALEHGRGQVTEFHVDGIWAAAGPAEQAGLARSSARTARLRPSTWCSVGVSMRWVRPVRSS